MATKQQGGMIDLLVQDYKGVKKLHVVLVPGANIIGGKNGAGKSSGVDAFANIFGGKKLTPSKPVREGAKGFRLQVVLEQQGITIARIGKIGENGKLRESLVITDAEGFQASSPQQLLDRLLGGHPITPEAFSELKAADQIGLLRQVTGLDFTQLDGEYQALYQKRHDIGIEMKNLQGQISKMPTVPEGTPNEPVSTSEITEQIKDGEANNRANADIRMAAAAKEREAEDAKATVGNLVEELKLARERRDLAIEEAKFARAAAGKLTDVDLDDLFQMRDDASEINQAVYVKQQRQAAEKALAKAQRAHKKAQDQMTAISEEKTATLSEAEMPVPGMSFDAEMVYLNGIPLEQCSQAERLTANVQMGLAAHAHSGAKLPPYILVREASLYDAEHLELLDEIARANGAYVLAERTMNTKEQAETEGAVVFLEDGIGLACGSDG